MTASDRPDLADFQCNGALAAAKAGRNPREIATQVVETLKGDARVEKLDIAGPGFVNFRVTDAVRPTR